ncbi:MAG: extracellular solute-binding protein [Deltaproteobacteria bacterium]|nr:extracellular solute-binding protein [Deltaproteobacteria bacterium]
MYFFKAVGLAFLLAVWAVDEASTAAPSPNLLKAKQEAEAKGFTFITSHDEVVAKAKKEGKIRFLASMDPANIKATIAAFRKKYPFIDIDGQESSGTDAARRVLLEVQSGKSKEWDVVRMIPEYYSEYTPYLSKVDLLGMAGHGVLQIPLPMIDQKDRNIIAFDTQLHVTAYNTKLVPANLVPKSWEELLRPELRGRKFAVDVRPQDIAALVPAWGLEKTLDFARKIAAQQPIWVRGIVRTLASIMAGEIPMMMGANFGNVKGAQRKDPIGAVQYVILEPAPVRLANAQAILATSQHPHAALLWLEWMAGPEAQKITDETEPFTSSVYVRGSAVEQETRGRKLSVVGWEHYHLEEQWRGKVVEAYGFPKAK